jgi:hypothetical protein
MVKSAPAACSPEYLGSGPVPGRYSAREVMARAWPPKDGETGGTTLADILLRELDRAGFVVVRRE